MTILAKVRLSASIPRWTRSSLSPRESKDCEGLFGVKALFGRTARCFSLMSLRYSLPLDSGQGARRFSWEPSEEFRESGFCGTGVKWSRARFRGRCFSASMERRVVRLEDDGRTQTVLADRFEDSA
jgi:hypothetical protein